MLDAAGGGGWGPVVTSTLLSRSEDASRTIGSVNAAEFFVTAAEVVAFSFAVSEVGEHLARVVLLILGGVAAAPLAVLLCKHQSAWETFALPALLPRPLAYVFKRELLRIPFFGWALGSLDMIHIDRGKPQAAMREVLKEGQRLLEQGVLVTLFPEGTRVARGQRGKYLHSGAQLAARCGAPVVPIAVTSARCWPPRGFVKLPGLIEMSIGAPIATDGRKATEVMAEVEQWIEAEMQRLDAGAYVALPERGEAPQPQEGQQEE